MQRLLVLLIGVLIGWWFSSFQEFESEENESPSSPKSPNAPTPPKVEKEKKAPAKPTGKSSSSAKDDLTELHGIGPSLAKELNSIGIHTFAQLAEQDPDELAEKLGGSGLVRTRIQRDEWIQQAQKRLTGK